VRLCEMIEMIVEMLWGADQAILRRIRWFGESHVEACNNRRVRLALIIKDGIYCASTVSRVALEDRRRSYVNLYASHAGSEIYGILLVHDVETVWQSLAMYKEHIRCRRGSPALYLMLRLFCCGCSFVCI